MLGILATATDFSVKYVLYSFSIRSVGKLRPQTFLDTVNLRGTVVFTIDFCRRQTRCPKDKRGAVFGSFSKKEHSVIYTKFKIYLRLFVHNETH